jgi:cellulose synthase/poly-beta-1,6-N-acetylglucosamine synthase-like glycosyltransferase
MAREDFTDADGQGGPARGAADELRWPSPGQVGAVHLHGAAGAVLGLTSAQVAVWGCVLGAVIVAAALWPHVAAATVYPALALGFGAVTILRFVAALIARPPPSAPPLADAALPTYTAIVPLYREAAMVEGLVRTLGKLDYPADRLQVLFALEADDEATLRAAAEADLPDHMRVVVVPPGSPRTKPRACNVALEQATGEIITLYDAEDEPAPGQLREAAARFADGPDALACLQAPLRIKGGKGFLARQFALEYAAQFEVVLPAMARLGVPFPLGGTSNHFRASALRDVGGWDPYNVTEDADIGFRLAERGYALSMLQEPTFEPAPDQFLDWMPQRARWVKGYMQTFGVHTRRPLAGGYVMLLALLVTLGVGIVSAFMHGPLAVWIAAKTLLWAAGGGEPTKAVYDLMLLTAGWLTAGVMMAEGARRADVRLNLADLVLALAYWPVQSLAALHALIQLFTAPHHWDKTEHVPPPACRPCA